jgi:hypothetical protein
MNNDTWPWNLSFFIHTALPEPTGRRPGIDLPWASPTKIVMKPDPWHREC